MRRRIKFCKFFLLKNVAFAIAWCMLIGNICFPVLAKDNTSQILSNNDKTEDQQEMDELENISKKENFSDGKSKEQLEGTEEEETPKDDKEKGESGSTGEEKTPGDDKGEGEPDGTGEEKNPGDDNEKEEPENPRGEEISDNDIKESKKSEKEPENGENETISGNDIEKNEPKDKKEVDKEQEIIDVVVPSTYVLALNPYRLPIQVGENEISEEQIISGTYGIVNKSSMDQIVTVSLIVEDTNGGKVVFVDSSEEAENAGEGIYAVYLSVVPANGEEILIDSRMIDKDVSGESLQNVEMIGAPEQAVTLYEGMNQISFKLSGAVYGSEYNEVMIEENANEEEENLELMLMELASDGTGVTAYTFSGVMNPNASWEELAGGIKLSVVYTYQKADGSEEIIEGTGALVK